jgi:hypothetical protein
MQLLTRSLMASNVEAMKENNFHESFSRNAPIHSGSDRNFGFVIAAAFAVAGVAPLFKGHAPRIWALALSALFFCMAVFASQLLGSLNKLWTKLGLVLHGLTTPVILLILFYLVFTPVAFFAKITGKKFLRLKGDPDAPTYWLDRQKGLNREISLREQF